MRILLVEDEYSLVDMIRESLEKESYVVDLFLNGEEDLYKARTEVVQTHLISVA